MVAYVPATKNNIMSKNSERKFVLCVFTFYQGMPSFTEPTLFCGTCKIDKQKSGGKPI